MALLKNRRAQALGAWALCFTQIFVAAGCRQSTGSGGGGGSGSTAAGATAGVNMGEILYGLLHHGYETKGETAKAAALAARKSDFVNAVNRIIPGDVGSNLFPTLRSLLPIVDDGTVERAALDADNIILDLMADPAAMDALAKLMGAAPATRGARSALSEHSRNVLISRLLAYPELEQASKAIFELVRDNDGVDDTGAANGEKNLLVQIQGLLSRQLLGYQPSATSGQSLAQALEKLSEALLSDQPLKSFPDLGPPSWAVRLDLHGNPQVAATAAGTLPVPFVDVNGDGSADINAAGEPVDAAGTAILIAPFGADGTRDSFGRALAPGGAPYYVYFDAKRTLVSELVLLTGQLLQKDAAGDMVAVMDGLADRVRHDNGTADPADDYDTLSPDSPLLDLSHAQFEMVKRTSVCDVLRGLGELVKRDPAKFSEMVDNLVVAIKKANTAAATVPARAGAGQALLNDLLPMIEDALRPRGRTTSAVRALLQAFNSEQRRLQTLPASFARMMKYHDYRLRILADATHPSVMQRVLGMMERANGCNVLGGSPSNMADFYLAAMAGNARIGALGISVNISIGTVNNLVDIGWIRRLLCSQITDADVRALKDFNDTGALDAMKPICAVFQQRGEISLLKNIMLGLGRHYDRAMRPTEPMAVALLESGAVEKLFLCIDNMTQVQVPGTTQVVADVLADTLQQVVDSSTVIYDRKNQPHRTLMHLMSAPMDAMSAKCAARGLKPNMDNLLKSAGDVLLQTYVDDRGTASTADDIERWKWTALNGSLGQVLASFAGLIPVPVADRGQWAFDNQATMERMLTSRDMATAMDVMKTIGSSPQKPVINRALGNLFTPNPTAAQDAFGAVVGLAADLLCKPNAAAVPAIDAQALATVLHFAGRQLDPITGHANGVVELIRKIIRADDGLLVLRVARNAFDMGPNGTDPTAASIVSDVMSDVSDAATGGGPTTVATLQTQLQGMHDFINDQTDGLPRFIARIKARAK